MDDEKLFESIQSYLARTIAEGFTTDDQIIEFATERFEDETGRDDLRPRIERLVGRLSARHRHEQSTWDRPTDCDRLDEAFADLESSGIVARQNFSCCTNCGHGEIAGEIQEMLPGREVLGYVFYHQQDTESAVDGDLYLAYGAVEDGIDPLMRVGRSIVKTLKQNGLKAKWNENPSTRIAITNLDWKRRRP